MKVKDLSGRIHSWSLGSYVGKENQNASALHIRTREFLEDNFPALQILEEVYLPGEKLYLDFFLPLKRIAIECQGIQHEKFNSHFYKDKLEFFQAKARDNRKLEFCRINNIQLIFFYPDEDVDLWMEKLNLKKV